jgi:hypothetical protein
VLEMSVRSSDRKFANMPVTKETMAKLRQLAGDRHYYSVIGELVDNALANKQAGLGGGFGSGTKSDDKMNDIIAKLTRIFGTERGRDILQKMEALHWDDEKRDALCRRFLDAEHFGDLDLVMIEIQRFMALQLEGLSPHNALGVLLNIEEKPINSSVRLKKAKA